MPLIKRPALTDTKIAANRRNQKLCHTSSVDPRRESLAAALRRFGFDLKADEAAMRALGEDPTDFQELLESLWEEWRPAGASQEGLVIPLARAMWLMNRAARMLEGCAVRQAQEVGSGRHDRVHARMMRLKITEERLQRLLQAVEQEYYVTTPQNLEKMKSLHQDGVLKEMGEITLALFYELQAPDTGADGIDKDEVSRRALVRIKEIFGLHTDTPPVPKVVFNANRPPDDPQRAGTMGPVVNPAPTPAPACPQETGGAIVAVTPPPSPPPAFRRVAFPTAEEQRKRYPSIRPADWEARERPRQLLENILRRQMEACAEHRQAILKQSVKGPTPYERAAEIAPDHPQAELMRKMQESNLREVRRLTTLLMKVKRFERQSEGLARRSARSKRIYPLSAKSKRG